MIRIHKETYEDLARYACETGFFNALQDYLEECGLSIKIRKVHHFFFIGRDTWDINPDCMTKGLVVFEDYATVSHFKRRGDFDLKEVGGYWLSPEVFAEL